MEPGIDTLVAQLGDAEAREAALRAELAAAQSSGEGGGLRGVITRAEVKAARTEAERLRAQNAQLREDSKVRSTATSRA